MKNVKRGFTLVEIMGVMAIVTIVLPMVFGVFIQGYKIINRTEKKTNVQNDFRSVIMNIENEINEIDLSEISGYLDNGITDIDNEASIEYKGNTYNGRYIIDISTIKKAFFEIEINGKKQIWKSEYSERNVNIDNVLYKVTSNKILASNMENTLSISARNNNGIITFNMNETSDELSYYGAVKTSENNDINIGVINEEVGTGNGSRRPILLANSNDGNVSIISNNKEVFFDNEKLGDYYVVDCKSYSDNIGNNAYGIHKNKGDGISLPIFKFDYVNNVTLENIDETLYYSKLNNEKVKITNLGESKEVISLGSGIRYFTVNDYKIYLFNTNKLTINNSTTNNLKWNKLILTDTIIICSGNIEINNSTYCSTNLSGSMIAGKNISVNNTDGSLIMYGESEKRLRISESTIKKIKSIISSIK